MIDQIKVKLRIKWQTSCLGRVKKDVNSLKWGVIGTGYMAHTFSKAITGSSNNILYAVASRSKNKALTFSKQYDAKKSYGNYEEMVKDENVEVVYIATPIECHYDNIKMALLANKHVLCEKPLTLTYEEAEELFQLAAERNLFLMEGMWTLCLPTIKKAKEWIASDSIGSPQFIRIDLNKRVNNNHIQNHHGVLNDYGVYAIAFMQTFLEEDAKIISAINRTNHNTNPTDWCILFKAGKLEGCLNIMSSLNAPSNALIIGEKGSIVWSSPFNRTNHIILFDEDGILIDEFKTSYLYEGFEFQLNEVYNCIKNGQSESRNIPSKLTLNSIRIIQSLNNE